MTFFSPVSEGIAEVERRMQAQAQGYHPDLQAALDHLISAGGKRVRPGLTLLAGRMLGGDMERLITLATAIELLHTATLVHDDLIDGSLLRRGNPTLNASWSPGATVLTGDFIFARAAETAAATESVRVIKLFSQTLTTIVNGEITQLFTSRCDVDRPGYYRRIYAKTASLFETSTTAAAILAGADEGTISDLQSFGKNLGMAFQIVDDILDFTSEAGTLGKPVGSDLRQGILTLPAIAYIENHPEDPYARSILSNGCTGPIEEADRLVEAIRSSSAIDQSFAEAQRFVEAGLFCLDQQPPKPERLALIELARYLVKRQQ